MRRLIMTAGFVVLCGSLWLHAQVSSQAPVPPLVNFSGVLTDTSGKPMTNLTGVTFLLYSQEQGGAPLWMETQNVQPDPTGHYSVMLGSTTSAGLPSSLFVAGEARWLGVQPQGQSEQPRVMLLSVPYALVAGNAQTVGGLPASAFVLAAAPTGGAGQNATPGGTPTAPSVGGSGTLDYIPLWIDSSGDLGNSVMFQSGTGSTAKIGINTITPATTLDVKGSATVRGYLETPAIANATATKGYDSNPMALVASGFNSSTSKPVTQNFVWQAEPVGNDTTTPSGTLNLLFGAGAATPAETGLHIASNGQINFASGQTFPGTGTGNGTVTSVASGLGLIGGPITTTGTLTIDTTVVPQLNVANVFTGNQTVNGNLSATGVVTGSGYQIGSYLFAFGTYSASNAFLGFAGNSTMSAMGNTGVGEGALGANSAGNYNTAVGNLALFSNVGDTGGDGWDNTAAGYEALYENTTGWGNTASGAQALTADTTGWINTAAGYTALYENTTGWGNTASGSGALFFNATGDYNTAAGNNALNSNTTGSYNTALGYMAGPDINHSNLTYASAIGAYATVSQSNALVLGGTGTAAVNVGIDTATPAYRLTLAQGSGGAMADAWSTWSSRRWKTNIQPLHGALGKVEQLRGVSYDLKANGKHEIGVIAEEVGAVVPEVVSYEKNGTDAAGVDYSRLTALLIEATKEQQSQIRKQQEQIRAQQKQIASQKSESALQRAQIARLISQMRAIQASLNVDGRTAADVRVVKTQAAGVHP